MAINCDSITLEEDDLLYTPDLFLLKENKRLSDIIADMRKRLLKLEDRLLQLEYAPGGPGYVAAFSDFQSLSHSLNPDKHQDDQQQQHATSSQ